MILCDNSLPWGVSFTEQKVYEKLSASVICKQKDRAYLAFPWSSLFDSVDSHSLNKADLNKSLELLKDSLSTFNCIATVCQSKKFRTNLSLFNDMGVTHIFTCHTKFQDEMLGNISVLPFPEFFTAAGCVQDNYIYKDTVVLANESIGTPVFFDADLAEPEEFWFNLEAGLLPVISEKGFCLPGEAKLWSLGFVLLNKAEGNETKQLLDVYHNRSMMSSKKNAIKQLLFLYGSDVLITDLIRFLLEPKDLNREKYFFNYSLKELIDNNANAEMLLNAFYTRFLVDFDGLYNEVQHDSYTKEYFSSVLKSKRDSKLGCDVIASCEQKGWALI